jgi:hypothetical protein
LIAYTYQVIGREPGARHVLYKIRENAGDEAFSLTPIRHLVGTWPIATGEGRCSRGIASQEARLTQTPY